MGRTGRRAAAVAALGTAVVALLAIGARETRAQADPGTRALEYLEAQQSAVDGSVPGGFSVNDLYAIGAAAGGYDPSTLSHGGPSVVDYLTANAAAACPPPTATSPSAGGCGELIQAALAAGKDPHTFGSIDLVARLISYDDPASGKYGDGEAFTEALAIQALVAAAQPVPSTAVTFLHTVEDSDGGWDFMDVHDDPNAATNFDTSDSNSTAMVLMALDATGDHSRDTAALTWLHSLQNTDGGFSFQGGGSDPDSTALVLQGILASGGAPSSAAWTVQGHTPGSYLVAAQDPSGGYTFPGNAAPDAFTTAQVPPALFGHPFPLPAASTLYTPGRTLGSKPPAATPPPTPAPTPSVNAGPVTGPTPQQTSAAVTPQAAAGELAGSTAAQAPAKNASAAKPPAKPGASSNALEPNGLGLPDKPSVPGAAPRTPAPRASGAPAAQRSVAQLPAPGGGLPNAVLYALAALGGAALVGSTGYLVTRR